MGNNQRPHLDLPGLWSRANDVNILKDCLSVLFFLFLSLLGTGPPPLFILAAPHIFFPYFKYSERSGTGIFSTDLPCHYFYNAESIES